MWQFWIDRGGTFTDIVARSPDGMLKTHKLLSENPEQYADAAIQGIHDILDIPKDAHLPSNSIHAVKMGTTVATNALLERKGDKTLLLMTQGMGDFLRVGYQTRPKLFDLNIILPEQLYSDVIEITERVSAQGDILTPLNEAQADKILRQAFTDGYRSVAVAFMHGYKFQTHEKRVGALAQKIGFEQISLSHQVSPLVKLVGRADTTVVDAYLSPILRRYVNQVRHA
nr:hydantoinase/oxoprolinase family protein [Alphaproteobacteria bacterium]